MTVVGITLSSDYGFVIIVGAILALEVVLIGGFFPGRLRRRIFNERFMKQKFAEIHAAQLQQEIAAGGYPDMGNGRYSQLLSYAEWYEFNLAQRAHLNFVESIASMLFCLGFGGLYYPIEGACFGLLIILGRLIYAIGYSAKGPKGRSIGALMSTIGFLANVSLSIVSAVKLIQGYSPGLV